ncbi:zona pellucida sperm-binding protein 3-like isoform X1 [Pseudochaenichthys georgianus]|uniref:zona pellucida sperm-binding protein 3-like isoform X1 n=1 Tax=Pseudochaenichthys georgianus TaxID=52239 RepID=UPI00146A9164|nr:zona pellucida sperm-binding protein 3-like isoform X1 [Pseudochaenichthys georgianus]
MHCDSSKHAVMMVSFCQGALLLILAAAMAVYAVADMKVDCGPDFVTLMWTESRPQADTSLLRLGSCFPTSFSAGEAYFYVDLTDCNFRILVTGDVLLYSNDLTYAASDDSYNLAFTHPVVCAYERPKDWYSSQQIYDPVFKTYGLGDLQFTLGLMNDDFSGPAECTRYLLGTIIPIMASVVQKTHQPLLLLLEECVAATTPELHPESTMYPIISNKGCLLESVLSQSKFEPRQKSSEMRLSLQTFKFAMGEEVFIHCKLLAWDPNGLDSTKKACHFVKGHGWELLDNLAQSNLCDCCESKCKSRRQRSVASEKHGMVQKAVIGPFTITDVNS